MDPRNGETPGRTRGRVVMLVDNDVRGDSRVQKAAHSAAAAGWEVVLLGELRDSTAVASWRIGDAEVRLVPLGIQLAVRPSRFRRSVLRRPLAYPFDRTAGYRLGLAQARQADIRVRLAVIKAARDAGGGRWSARIAQARLLPRRIVAKVAGRWAGLRAEESRRLKEARRKPSALLNVAPVHFWKALLGTRSWRRLDPSLWRWELAFGPVIDELRPDLIHAHDFRMLGPGARAALRARAQGRRVKLVWDAHEYLPGLSPRPDEPTWLPALCAHEREFAPYADAVVTVSPALAELLQAEHQLRHPPAVVMNAPVREPTEEQRRSVVADLRVQCGLDRATPLLVYCGGITPVRGIDLMVDALAELVGVHIALVSLHPNGRNAASEQVLARARRLGVADRVHLLPYVAHWEVSEYLAPADAAVSALHHLPNHEIALSNKFFEYSHARLPLVVSDVRTMAEMVRSTGQGEVFRARDLADYVRAVRAVLADPDRYRAAYDRPGLLEAWTWEAQARVLDRVYSGLLPRAAGGEWTEPRQARPAPVLENSV